jgi:hypothetical protein
MSSLVVIGKCTESLILLKGKSVKDPIIGLLLVAGLTTAQGRLPVIPGVLAHSAMMASEGSSASNNQ